MWKQYIWKSSQIQNSSPIRGAGSTRTVPRTFRQLRRPCAPAPHMKRALPPHGIKPSGQVDTAILAPKYPITSTVFTQHTHQRSLVCIRASSFRRHLTVMDTYLSAYAASNCINLATGTRTLVQWPMPQGGARRARAAAAAAPLYRRRSAGVDECLLPAWLPASRHMPRCQQVKLQACTWIEMT
jgi:hypothetical protein